MGWQAGHQAPFPARDDLKLARSADLSLADLPARKAIGAFIVNSGLHKRDADRATTTRLHGLAKWICALLHQLDVLAFARLLSAAEIALGSALMVAIVPTALVDAGPTAFSAPLIGLYLRTLACARKRPCVPRSCAPHSRRTCGWLESAGLSGRCLAPRQCHGRLHRRSSRSAAFSTYDVSWIGGSFSTRRDHAFGV